MPPVTPASPPTPPAFLQVFYDGACPLCSREVRHYQAKDRLHHIAWIDIAAPGFDARAYGLDPQRVQQVMYARAADGTVFIEVAAFVKIWEALPPTLFSRLVRGLLKLPGMMAIAGVGYRFFARNRYRLTGRCTPENCTIPPPPAKTTDKPAV